MDTYLNRSAFSEVDGDGATQASILLLTGPGHGAPANLANLWVDGCLEDVYPHLSRDREGLGRLIKDFSWPGGFPSHVAPIVPGTIHEGGELGYALATAVGAVLDNPDLIAAAITVSSVGGILLSLVRTLPLLALTGLLWQAFSVATAIASVAWLKDLLPEENRGKFLGIRMIFWIAIPMVVGPWIGSTLIQNYGIPTTQNGETGFIPVPIIFQVGSIIALLSLIPLYFLKDKKHEDALGTHPTHSAA